MHRKVAAAIVAALALAVASCGGSETTTLDRAELLRRAELACRSAGQVTEQQTRAEGRSPNAYKALLAGQKALVERLEKLEGSGDLRDDFNSYKDGVRTRLDALEKVTSAPRAEQPRVLRSVQREAVAAGRQIGAAVDKLGLRGCG
jgi:uncharacterized protein (DUF885 family)